MADDTTQPAAPAGTPENPMIVQIAAQQPGGPVFPTPDMDVAPVPGGAYRFVSPFDGSETWKDAEGNEIKKPKGK